VLESPVLAMQQDIRTNLERVRERIARAAERAGRRPEDVLLVGVSKTVDVGRIRAAVAAGLTALGENRVQEARGKVAEVGRAAAWHLVGHLQTNKVRDALELFDVVHSVDRIDLARELDRRARARGKPVDALVQVNVAAEPSKGGWPPDAVETAVEALNALAGLRVCGLMAIPPAVERAEESRGWFRALRKLAERHGLANLSMGMSGDFEVAVEEGATMVRVGTAIFGPRPPRFPDVPQPRFPYGGPA
jgi:PLP dependent protein